MKLITKNPKRGSAVILSLLFSAVISLLALAYVRAIPTEANSFLRSQRSTLAHYAAEAAVFDVMARIRFDIENDVEPAPAEFFGSINGWEWKATLTVDADNPPTGNSSLRFYEIFAEAFPPGVPATLGGTPARTVRATMGEETFARYSRFIDDFGPIQYNIGTNNFIQGHVHTNTHFNMEPRPSLYTIPADQPAAFVGYVTSTGQSGSGDGVNYNGPDAPVTPAQYSRLYTGGREGLNTGVARIDMPESSGALALEAWGSTAPLPTTGDGLYINTDGTGMIQGGYYVVGDIDTFELAADTNGNPMITFTMGSLAEPETGELLPTPPASPLPPVPPGPNEFIIIEAVNAPASAGGITAPVGSTLVVAPAGGATGALSGATTFNGFSNGVHYSTGSIWSLQGTNTGSRLIAVETLTEEVIGITGDVLRTDTVPGTEPPGPDDVLGLLSHKVVVSRTVPRDPLDPLYLYFSFLAGRKNDTNVTANKGGFRVEHHDDASLGTGSFILYGAAGSGHNGPTGLIDGAGNITSGLGYRQRFDPHILQNPPPFFPTTGKLPITSWREEAGSH